MLEANQPQESLMIGGSPEARRPHLAHQANMRNRGAKGFMDRFIVPEEDDRDTIFQAAHGEGNSIFFSHLKILPDGGLSKTSMGAVLYTKTRVLMVVVSLFFVAFNLYTVLKAFISIATKTDSEIDNSFTLLIDKKSANSFWCIQLAISSFEVLSMAWMLSYSIYVGCKLYSSTDEKQGHYRLWHQVYDVSCVYVKTMGNFSAMRTLQFLNPQVLGSELAIALTQVEEGAGYVRVLLCFAVTSICLGGLGFVAFCIKFSSLVVELRDMLDHEDSAGYEAMDPINQVTLIFGFINQVFGITQVWQVEQKRLFLFIFGGEDAAMQAGEVDRQEAFLACVAEFVCTELYKDVPSEATRRWQRAVALLGFTHLDVQSLVLLEDESLEVDADTIRSRAAESQAPAESAPDFVSFESTK